MNAVKKIRAKLDGGVKTKTYAEFKDGRRVYDSDVAAFARKHMKLIDRLNFEKVAVAVLSSFAILSDENPDPKDLSDGWKFHL